MTVPRGLALVILALCPSALSAQNEIIYYKFDEAGGTRVINYAPATSPAAEEGNITTTDPNGPFAPGRIGLGSLRGGPSTGQSFVESGWNGAFSGDFTVAFFAKHRSAPPSATYLFGLDGGSFRGFTAGVANRGFLVRSWGGMPADLPMTKDFQTMVMANWVHLALVVDTSRSSATYYLDGVAEPAITITAGANVPGATSFRAGGYTTPHTTYDLDEFRFLNRAATPTEILLWSQRTTPADSPFGKSCGATLGSSSGPPSRGNAGYALNLSGAAASQPFVLVLGGSRTTFFSVPLPFNIGNVFPGLQGCSWEASLAIAMAGATSGSGAAAQPMGIPNDGSLEAATLYIQALVLRLGTEQTSNPFAISIGG
jgi:hypothetical protein